jgi:polysaccharide biosynthesis/export protein
MKKEQGLQILLSVLNPIAIALLLAKPGMGLPLSPGDRLKVSIPEGELFNGNYAVNLDGMLQIPHLQPLRVGGLEPAQVEQNLKQELIQEGMFNPAFVRVTMQVTEWAPVQVEVVGATFQPGRVLVNERKPEDRALLTQISGDYPPERFLTAAIRAAGGVLPNADVKNIHLIRNGQDHSIDLSGVLTGSTIQDVPVIAGDQIVVPDAGHFQNELVRPSQITIEGVRVFLSNLTEPASSNSSSAISKDATSFVYGSRLSQAVIAANCAGGSRVNAKRHVLLVRTDRMTGHTQVVDRPIEDLLRKANEDPINPLLMPDDGIACYDSNATNVRGVAQILSDIFNPFALLLNLFK